MTLNFNLANCQPTAMAARSSLWPQFRRQISAWAVVAAALVGLVLTACGGGSGTSAQDTATRAVAEQNQANLMLTDDLALTELLDGSNGEITNLREIVTGDRAVLLWYWAPN